MNDISIQTHDLRRDFGAVRAVNDLNITVEPGIVFGFLGPNGSGKTTTIRLLLGLLEPSSGRAEVLGFDTQTEAEQIRQQCGALMENNGLYERLSAENNLEFYGRVWRLPSGERQARIQELLAHFGLWERRKDIVANWSRGMKQKLALARTLLHRPRLIFLDEPTAGLDPVAAAALRNDLALLAAREGVTIFLNTHNLAEAEKLCQKVGIIRQGNLLAVGSLDALRAQAGGARVHISGRGFTPQVVQQLEARPEVAGVESKDDAVSVQLQDAAESAPLIQLLVNAGVAIDEVRKGKANLEEAFLSLVEEEPNND